MKAMKKGFTLAEVLITLAIIGVVAALTIPTVVTNYKAKALETQKKKAMSVLSNGFRLLMANDDVASLRDIKMSSCEGDKECYANEFKRVFNIISDNTSENDIFHKIYQFSLGSKKVWTNLMFNYVFVTSDGMIFGLPFVAVQDGAFIVIMADINGVKNPNKGGQDLCQFNIDEHGGITDHCEGMADWGIGPVELCEAEGGTWTHTEHCYGGACIEDWFCNKP